MTANLAEALDMPLERLERMARILDNSGDDLILGAAGSDPGAFLAIMGMLDPSPEDLLQTARAVASAICVIASFPPSNKPRDPREVYGEQGLTDIMSRMLRSNLDGFELGMRLAGGKDGLRAQVSLHLAGYDLDMGCRAVTTPLPEFDREIGDATLKAVAAFLATPQTVH